MGKRKAGPPRRTKVVGASLEPGEVRRLDAFGERLRSEQGLRLRRGPLAAMLIRKGLDAVEAEASSGR